MWSPTQWADSVKLVTGLRETKALRKETTRSVEMKAKTILTLLGVSWIAFALGNHSESEDGVVAPQPMELRDAGVGGRTIETPEVVLQLKYDRGELDRVYLAQFRQGVSKWAPSVPARSDLCADLCHAGLGGAACGSSCQQMVPVGLKSALTDGNQSDIVYGKPRDYVCPTLCDNHLGDPLCSCAEKKQLEADMRREVDWSAICDAFCITDRFQLAGCPACRENYQSSVPALTGQMRVLNTAEGWSSWCNVQCRQGQGGAACNCDRAPFQ
ncbi:uncharacterized protein [Battus philenor]|uniref:uncharacterized protein n=1 Tax=Battus philenor TaxID=42288 RepID=UPI0035CFA8CB